MKNINHKTIKKLLFTILLFTILFIQNTNAQCSIDNIISNDVSCKGECNGFAHVFAITGTGPYSYSWSTGSTAQAVQNLCPNNYTVSITDNTGCSASTSVTITEPISNLTVKTTATPANCNGSCNGSLTATASGGTSNYIFSFQPNGYSSTSNPITINGLCAGCYTVYVTDANGCSAYTSCIVISEPPALVVTTSTTPSTAGNSDGSANANVIGGTPGYFYSWNPPVANTQTITGLTCGIYVVTVTDANYCSVSATAVVNCVTGISELNADISFNLYPNPAKDNITIETITNKPYIMQIINLLGETVYNTEQAANKINIAVGILPKGIYIVQVRDVQYNISGRQRLVIR